MEVAPAATAMLGHRGRWTDYKPEQEGEKYKLLTKIVTSGK